MFNNFCGEVIYVFEAPWTTCSEKPRPLLRNLKIWPNCFYFFHFPNSTYEACSRYEACSNEWGRGGKGSVEDRMVDHIG